MIEYEGYKVGDPDALETPAMLVFEAQLDHNIQALCELAGEPQNLIVHVKTHKSEAVTRKQIEAGIRAFKCATLKELEMVLAAGAAEAVLAYPMVQGCKAERFAELAAAHPQAQVCTLVSAPLHLQVLAGAAAARDQEIKVMLDLDSGMHRTGIGPGEEAVALYRAASADQYLEVVGLHLYDGHEHRAEPEERRAAAQRQIDAALAFKEELQEAGLEVPQIVAGNTFSFPYYARAEGMRGSPGTCVYWDAEYGAMMKDMPFRWAALVLNQVVDRYPQQQTITTDLGSKAVPADLPLESRARLLGKHDASLVLQNEEHGVFSWPGELPEVGTYLLAVPGHVCPTAIRYPGSYVIDAAGDVIDYYPHTARDRQ
jgi:D-serine deaminase-like pyridoxal phosphate-dependent protein